MMVEREWERMRSTLLARDERVLASTVVSREGQQLGYIFDFVYYLSTRDCLDKRLSELLASTRYTTCTLVYGNSIRAASKLSTTHTLVYCQALSRDNIERSTTPYSRKMALPLELNVVPRRNSANINQFLFRLSDCETRLPLKLFNEEKEYNVGFLVRRRVTCASFWW